MNDGLWEQYPGDDTWPYGPHWTDEPKYADIYRRRARILSELGVIG